MNLHQLEYIVAVDQLKNFNKAAGACLVTQATLSAMVKKLEEELDIVIFDRKTKPVITTASGKEIIEEARKTIFHANRLKEISKSIKNKVEGRVKIGIIPTIANSLLPNILKELLDKYPLLELDFMECTNEQLIKKLKEGLVDFGILASPLQETDIEQNFLYYESLLIYGDLDESKNYVLPKNLKKYNFWMLEEGKCLLDNKVEVCNLKQNASLFKNLKFEANSFETLLNLADKFGGLTLIPELYYNSLSEERKKKVRKFQTPIPVREISIAYFRPYAKLRFINLIAKEIQDIVNNGLGLLSNSYKKNELSVIKI